MVGHMFSTLIPQDPKPVVRMVTSVAALVGLLPGIQYRAVQIRPTKPMFRKVAA